MQLIYYIAFMQNTNILIAVKKAQPQAQVKATEIMQYLKDNAIEHTFVQVGFGSTELSTLSKNFSAVLVLGGDGTMLEVLKHFAGTNIPCLGINFGKVGFLCQVAPDHTQKALQKLLNNKYQIEQYLGLNWKLTKGKKCLASGIAINDVVIARGHIARTVRLQININNEILSNLRADGLIVSSPLGSTAYANSAGGPIIYPKAKVINLTSVCPIIGTFNPIVIDANDKIRIKNSSSAYESFISIDGQEGPKLQNGEFLEITAQENAITLAVDEENWYINRLKSRNFIK